MRCFDEGCGSKRSDLGKKQVIQFIRAFIQESGWMAFAWLIRMVRRFNIWLSFCSVEQLLLCYLSCNRHACEPAVSTKYCFIKPICKSDAYKTLCTVALYFHTRKKRLYKSDNESRRAFENVHSIESDRRMGRIPARFLFGNMVMIGYVGSSL